MFSIPGLAGPLPAMGLVATASLLERLVLVATASLLERLVPVATASLLERPAGRGDVADPSGHLERRRADVGTEHRRIRQAWTRCDDAQARHGAADAVEDGRRNAARPPLQLIAGEREPPATACVQLVGEGRIALGEGALLTVVEVGEQCAAMRPDVEWMPETNVVADPYEEARWLEPVDDHGVAAVADGQGHRLARPVHERPHCGGRQAAHLQAAAGPGAQLHERHTQMEATRVRVSNHEPRLGQGVEQPVEHGAVEPRDAGEFRDRSPVGGGAESLQDREAARERP
jgi:hypothetical protein